MIKELMFEKSEGIHFEVQNSVRFDLMSKLEKSSYSGFLLKLKSNYVILQNRSFPHLNQQQSISFFVFPKD